MATKIAFIGARLSNNLGGPSLLVSTKMVLNSVFTDADYILLVPRKSYPADKVFASKYDVTIMPFCMTKWTLFSVLIWRCSGILVGSRSVKATIKALQEADVIIDIWGILFADTIGSNTFFGRMKGGFKFILGKMLGKPVVKYTADIGPFNYRWNHMFAKLYLGHFIDLILVRNEASRQSVKLLGVKRRIMDLPDTAFLLPAIESNASKHYEKIRKESAIIGLSISFQARNRVHGSISYLAVMIDFVNYLIDKHGAHIVLIPNELDDSINDDLDIAEEICAKIEHKRCTILYTNNMLAQEVKGVINQCDAIVASRYHTIVAALSLGIPTLAIGWHRKYVGVLQLFNQEHRLCNIEELRYDDIVHKFENLWNNRAETRKLIVSRLPSVKKRIFSGAPVISSIVSAKYK
jgi:polysaccharide pyruvyl transferase WcaK-like protein